jgi:hypothetical protein
MLMPTIPACSCIIICCCCCCCSCCICFGCLLRTCGGQWNPA